MGLVSFFKGSIDYKNVSAPITKPTSIIIMAAGGFMMRIGYKGVTKNAAQEVKYLKCLGCGCVFFAHEAPDHKCPKCSGAVENLNGFFDRHPELRDKGPEKK